MAKDVRIVPADGKVTFYNASSTASGYFEQVNNDIVIGNEIGNVIFGDPSTDIYIGDGVSNIDLVFEQDGSIRGESGSAVTLTLGSDDTTIKLAGTSNQASEATSLMIDATGVVGTRELGSNAFNSTSYLPLAGGTLTGTLTFNNTTNTKIAFNDSSAYWLATSTNWGIYWNTSNNTLGFHGSGTERGYIDLDNGNLQMDGTGTFGTRVTATSFTGSLQGTATSAVQATTAGTANSATSASHAEFADATGNAATADYATDAGNALTAGSATSASHAEFADVAGSATSATNATNFNVAADNTTNATHYITFTGGATGNQRPNSDTSLTYNPSTNVLTTGTFSGNLSGNATSANTASWATNLVNIPGLAQVLSSDNGAGGLNIIEVGDLTATGTIEAGSFVETSARRFKENIVPISHALELVDQIQGVTFNRIGEERREYGFIADEVQTVAPELVSYDDTGQVHGVHYARTVAVLTEAVKELNNKVKAQDLFIRDLVARIEKLENN